MIYQFAINKRKKENIAQNIYGFLHNIRSRIIHYLEHNAKFVLLQQLNFYFVNSFLLTTVLYCGKFKSVNIYLLGEKENDRADRKTKRDTRKSN